MSKLFFHRSLSSVYTDHFNKVTQFFATVDICAYAYWTAQKYDLGKMALRKRILRRESDAKK